METYPSIVVSSTNNGKILFSSIFRSGADACFCATLSLLFFWKNLFLLNVRRYWRKKLVSIFTIFIVLRSGSPVKNDVWLKDQIFGTQWGKIHFCCLPAKTNIWWCFVWALIKKWCNENNADHCRDFLSEYNAMYKSVFKRLCIDYLKKVWENLRNSQGCNMRVFMTEDDEHSPN